MNSDEQRADRAERLRDARAALPDELDAPAPPLQVKVGGWTYPAEHCRAPGCTRLVPKGTGRFCDYCDEDYREQVRS
jgi:hypothetical protein